jgi:hypothetical protein
MANFVFNIAKGRVAELYNRVKTNDPANSALIIVVLASSGLESDAVLIDKETLQDVLAGSTDEVTNTGYARKVLTDTEIAAMAPDHPNDRMLLTIPNQTWTSVAAGSNWAKLLICYDNDTASGTDANIIPLTAHDFSVTPDGSDITMQVSSNGFYIAG